MSEPDIKTDQDIRHNLVMMNEMLDSIIRDANIPIPKIEEVNLEVSTDYQKMSEMILGKLTIIESCCDTAGISTDRKYDPKTIRDKIIIKKKQLAELESENVRLKNIADKQEKQLEKMGVNDEEKLEQQQKVLKLRAELLDAQKEIKELEEQRRREIEENNKKKVDLQKNKAPLPQDQEEKRERERRVYDRKMTALKAEEQELRTKQQELEEEIKQKEKILKEIHDKQPKPLQRKPRPKR